MSNSIDPRQIEVGKAGQAPQRERVSGRQPADGSFRDLFSKELEKGRVTLSNHARERLARRNLDLDGAAIRRVESALDRLGEKGSRSALIMLDDLALVANVPGRKVVTAIDIRQSKEQVFTNIDSAVIA